tara:strand:- start:18941 stop:20026 length:1086 start_codon:yes stop_codon:yes gene_type:complete
MTNKLKILHLASFTGNLGDSISHKGLSNVLKEKYKNHYTLNRLEIRRMYQNSYIKKIKCNSNLISYINKHDLFLIGGGGFLSPVFDKTATGTTFDFNSKFIDSITTETIFTSIGGVCKPKSKSIALKFKEFMKHIENQKYINLCLRNDGSIDELTSLLGESKLNKNIINVVDNAFYYEKNKDINISDTAVINIGYDQVRQYIKKPEKYYKWLAHLVEAMVIKDYCSKVIFVPHTFQDLKAISDTLSYLADDFIRYYIGVETLAYSKKSITRIENLYNCSKFILGGRYHSNIMGIIFNKNSVPTYSHPRVTSMLESLKISSRDLYSSELSIEKALKNKVSKLSNVHKIINKSKKIFLDILPY